MICLFHFTIHPFQQTIHNMKWDQLHGRTENLLLYNFVGYFQFIGLRTFVHIGSAYNFDEVLSITHSLVGWIVIISYFSKVHTSLRESEFKNKTFPVAKVINFFFYSLLCPPGSARRSGRRYFFFTKIFSAFSVVNSEFRADLRTAMRECVRMFSSLVYD